MKALEWVNEELHLLDQTLLPHKREYIICKNYIDVAEAIKQMKVRGAPAIGVSAAYGVVLGANEIKSGNKEDFYSGLMMIVKTLRETRPTAVNLFWALDRMTRVAKENESCNTEDICRILKLEADNMAKEDAETNRAIGEHGNALIHQGDIILTHCNAGALATVDYGTALGVIRTANNNNKDVKVYADETRPYLQGARLTAFELMEDGIPVTLITDSMAGYFMNKGVIKKVIVGADRIANNGDVANKIGTYSIAVLAHENNIPFYVAAPISTIDMELDAGMEIPIEERNEKEVTFIGESRIAPEGVKVANPAFDVTPNKYVSAIITEKGVIYPPYKENLLKLFTKKDV